MLRDKIKWPENYNYFAVDSNGMGYFYKYQPTADLMYNSWEGKFYKYSKENLKEAVGCEHEVIAPFGPVELNGVPWTETLIQKPEEKILYSEIEKSLTQNPVIDKLKYCCTMKELKEVLKEFFNSID